MTDPTPTPSAIPPSKPIWTRWWMIVIYVIVGIAILGNLAGGDDSSGDDTVAGGETTTTQADSTDTTESPEPTTTTVPPTTTTTVPPTTTTTLPPGFDPFTVEGSGDDFIDFTIPDDLPAVLTITGNASGRHFAVQSYTAANDSIDLLVNTTDPYEGSVPTNFLVGEEVGLLEITATGDWTITATFLGDLPEQAGTVTGTGDSVIHFLVGSPSLTFGDESDGHIAVLAWTTEGRDLLVNEIGPYQGTVRSPTGTVFFQITSEGNWTLEN